MNVIQNSSPSPFVPSELTVSPHTFLDEVHFHRERMIPIRLWPAPQGKRWTKVRGHQGTTEILIFWGNARDVRIKERPRAE